MRHGGSSNRSNALWPTRAKLPCGESLQYKATEIFSALRFFDFLHRFVCFDLLAAERDQRRHCLIGLFLLARRRVRVARCFTRRAADYGRALGSRSLDPTYMCAIRSGSENDRPRRETLLIELKIAV